MSKNPLLNALAALGYISIVAFVMSWGSKVATRPNEFLAPIAFISLFTLSAAVMAYLFGYQPAQLYFSGKKEKAVKLFLQELAAFGLITAVLLVIVFSGFGT